MAQLAVNVIDFAKARLPELEALDVALDAQGKRDAPRHLRRRTRSHTAPFVAKTNKSNPTPTRRARRTQSELLKAHDPHGAETALRFLETHAWHAKRFAMVDCEGWRRPDYRRDRGLKAAVRSLRTAALVFDTTDRVCEISTTAPHSVAVPGGGHWLFATPAGPHTYVPGGLVRFEVRGARAADVVASLIGMAPSENSMALAVPDPRDRGDAVSTASDAIFSETERRASSRAVAARTDDVVNAARHAATRPVPLFVPCLVIRRPAAHGAGGWDVVAPPHWGRPLWHVLVRHACGHAGGRKERRLVDAAAAGEDLDAYIRREGPGRPRREKKRWAPVPKKKKPPSSYLVGINSTEGID